MDEEIIRVEALAWLDVVSGAGDMEMTRDQLANDFSFRGVRFPLIDRGKGIRRPGGWSAALSITTTAPKSGSPAPYDDVEGADGLHRYKLRRDEGGKHENERLRAAMRDGLPIAHDRNILGIRPDYRVEIREQILLEVDGPMLRHGLQELHGGRLMALPSRRQDQPDPDRLEERYVEFRNAF